MLVVKYRQRQDRDWWCDFVGEHSPHVFTALGSALSTKGKTQVCYNQKKRETLPSSIVSSALSNRRNWEQDKLMLGRAPVPISPTA